MPTSPNELCSEYCTHADRNPPDDSDDEHKPSAAVAQPSYSNYPPQDPYASSASGYPAQQNPYGSGPPGVLPATDADGNSVSSSDREEVQEARDKYEEELAEASSSSDAESVREAREEYEEAYEETYED